jgi:glutamate synthase (ferredoxin)
MYFIAEELREIMAGFRTLKKWLDNLKTVNVNKAIKHYKTSGLDLSSILYKPEKQKFNPENTTTQDHALETLLDFENYKSCYSINLQKRKTRVTFDIKNTESFCRSNSK